MKETIYWYFITVYTKIIIIGITMPLHTCSSAGRILFFRSALMLRRWNANSFTALRFFTSLIIFQLGYLWVTAEVCRPHHAAAVAATVGL